MRYLIAANWKMNKTVAETLEYIENLNLWLKIFIKLIL
jgi:hypothetical protein